jgi:nucleotide-binding universal stress UspA family protein
MYDDVLVTTDGSDEADAAVPHAIDLAEKYGARLHVLSVVDVRPWSKGVERSMVVDDLGEEAEDDVGAVADRARDHGLEVATTVEPGIPHGEILDYVDDRDVDLVVMGTHGRTGIGHALLGSVAEKVVRHSTAPVLTVGMDEDDG